MSINRRIRKKKNEIILKNKINYKIFCSSIHLFHNKYIMLSSVSTYSCCCWWKYSPFFPEGTNPPGKHALNILSICADIIYFFPHFLQSFNYTFSLVLSNYASKLWKGLIKSRNRCKRIFDYHFYSIVRNK